MNVRKIGLKRSEQKNVTTALQHEILNFTTSKIKLFRLPAPQKILSICALLIWKRQNSQSYFFHLLPQKKRISVFQPALAMHPYPVSAKRCPRVAVPCSEADGR